MTSAQRIGLVLALAAGLGLSGCARLQPEMPWGWAAAMAVHPKAPKLAAHRHKTRVARRARVADPDVTGSTPVPTKADAAESAVMRCSRKLYLETATSTEQIRAAEVACRQLIVNQPYGGQAN